MWVPPFRIPRQISVCTSLLPCSLQAPSTPPCIILSRHEYIVRNVYNKYHYYALLYSPITLPYSTVSPSAPYSRTQLTDSFPLVLGVKCNLLRNNKQKYSVLYSHICVVSTNWGYKILCVKSLRAFPEMNLFLIYSFMQFDLAVSFIIFEFCYILKFSIAICRVL